jgi:hypothetical protein
VALTYQLREGMTNADLPDGGNQETFGFLTTMMLTKVGKLDDKGLALYKERIAQYAQVAQWSVEHLDLHFRWAEELQGITTNIQTESKARWKAVLWDILQERANQLAIYTRTHREENS